MDERYFKLRIKDVLEIIYVILLASIPFINVIFGGKIVNIIFFCLCFITLIIVILNRKIGTEYIILSIILIGLIVYKYYTKELRIEMEFILFIISILALRRTKYKKILKVYFITQVILYGTVVILNKIGIIKSVYIYRRLNGIITQRESLGFNHPNIAYRIYFNIIVTYLLIRNKKIKNIELIFISVISFLMYMVTDSRNGLICSILVILFIFIFKNIKINKITNMIKYVFLLLFIISFIVTNFYDNNITILKMINNITSNRLYAINMYLENINLSLFGHAKIINNVAFDNFYMYILCLFGIISVIIYGRYYRKLYEVFIEKRLIIEIIVTTIVLIYGLFESSIMYPYSNITLLLITLIYNEQFKKSSIKIGDKEEKKNEFRV